MSASDRIKEQMSVVNFSTVSFRKGFFHFFQKEVTVFQIKFDQRFSGVDESIGIISYKRVTKSN